MSLAPLKSNLNLRDFITVKMFFFVYGNYPSVSNKDQGQKYTEETKLYND